MNVFKFSLTQVIFRVIFKMFNKRSRLMYSNETTIVVTYLAYLLVSVTLTIWVARTLHKRGAIYLVDAFHGNAELAASVNHLLVVGFYLINIGFVTLALKSTAQVTKVTKPMLIR